MGKAANRSCARPPGRSKPSKPQALKKTLVKLARAQKRRAVKKPHVVSEGKGLVKGLVLGQAPPGPRKSLPRAWRPLAGPAEQRLARLAKLSVAEFWQHYDRANLLSWYPGLKTRSERHDVSKGYKLHTSDGDVFPMDQAKMAAAKLELAKYRSVLLLGTSVARAFGVSKPLLHTETRGQTRLLVFPHPSGVSHYWNDPKNTQKAAKALRRELRAMRR
ncbi:unnamed protein product [Symbiodinium pilosum]|uniref:Uracil-DNA glycosylase-like domain-containing protein n=1 Tax=Symbiodinium pilosum TaxID=2952 RepID=A0A812W5X2_SYMPI|nr:unnamed protein product [Symbiodinium pilosum]